MIAWLMTVLVVGVALPSHAVSASPGTVLSSDITPRAIEDTEFDIDRYWSELFATDGLAYSTPAVFPVSDPVNSGCGYVTPDQYLAFYCLVDLAVYWSVPGYEAAYAGAGDAAWINVMAHEWSHHVQYLLGLNTVWRQTNDPVGLELEATCMGGSYVGSAQVRGLVDAAMIPAMLNMFSGDAAHGSTDQIQTAFRNGVDNGIAACGLDL
jgi:predicted metalloprotease